MRSISRRSTLADMRKLVALAFVLLLPSSLLAQKYGWLGTWTTANMPMDPARAAKLNLGTAAVTIRQILHISQGGKQVRVRFSNEFGTSPLQITSAHLAFLSTGSRILVNTDKALLFAGQGGTTIPPGGVVASDPITETVPIFSDLVISTALAAQPVPVVTHHGAAYATTYIAQGDYVAAEEFASPLLPPPGLTAPNVAAPILSSTGETQIVSGTRPAVDTQAAGRRNAPAGEIQRVNSWFFLKDVEVDAEKKSSAVVCFGDSITDGAGSTPETNRRWPDVLAPLLAAGKHTSRVAVLNVGIGGNRLLHDGTGPKASDRFERDVLSQPGAKFVILLEGINDIGHGGVTAQQLIDSMTDLATRAHTRGLRIFGGTLTPYQGAGYYTPEGEQIRQAVNAFLRANTVFDGVIDFDKAVQDPNQPTRFLPKYDRGDHLHPSDFGYAAMAPAIPLQLFRKKK